MKVAQWAEIRRLSEIEGLSQRARDREDGFDALGPEARQFHVELPRRPVKTAVHVRRILNLVRRYAQDDVPNEIGACRSRSMNVGSRSAPRAFFLD